MTLDELGQYLEANSVGLLGNGGDLILGSMPDTAPDECTVLYEYLGLPSSKTSGGVLAEWPRIQVMCRGWSYSATRARAERVHQLLDGKGEIDIEGVRYHWIEAMSPPFLIGRDENGRVKIGCNYQICKARSKQEG